VVNDTTFHTILVLKRLLGPDAGQFDIETAFLYGELEEELWMDLPEGYAEYLQKMKQEGKQEKIPITSSDYIKQEITNSLFCCELKKAIYGLVQAARHWWKKFKEVIRQIGYKPSLADPCLFVKDNGGKSFIIIYVDDGGIFGTQDEIKQVLKELSKTFKVKDLGKLENFIGCKIIENQAKDTLWIHQPKLLKTFKTNLWKIN
jgi:Reverse transcriptase (RNA-dependent DNA polymerase)